MRSVAPGEFLKVLGAHVRLEGAHTGKIHLIVAAAWKSFNATAPLWREGRSRRSKLQAWHLSVFHASRVAPAPGMRRPSNSPL